MRSKVNYQNGGDMKIEAKYFYKGYVIEVEGSAKDYRCFVKKDEEKLMDFPCPKFRHAIRIAKEHIDGDTVC